MKTYRSFSSDETRKFGELLAQRVINHSSLILERRRAIVLALQGNLGAGKTTFTQGFFNGLGIKQRAISPTFVIMRRYRIPKRHETKDMRRGGKRNSSLSHIYHFDAYRLKKAEDMEVLKFDATLSDPRNLILIEWPERIKDALPKTTVWLKFEHGKKENERIIRFKN